MKKWLRRIRGAVAMGLTWAAGWTLVGMLGVVVFYALFPDVPDVVDIWIPVFAYPGFLAGVGFSVVLGSQRATPDSMNCRFPGSPHGERWLVCCRACFRLLWERRVPDSRCGCWVSQ